MFSENNCFSIPTKNVPFIPYEGNYVPYEHQFTPYEQQIAGQRYYQKIADKCIDIAKAACIEEIRTQAWLHRQRLREEAAERRKAEFDELIISKNGDFRIVTRNTSVLTTPREICNATHFESYIVKNMSDILDELLLIVCDVNGDTKEIFLNPEKFEKQGYISRKFTCAGVSFYLSGAKKKDALEQIIALSYNNISSPLYLPNETGWIRNSNEEVDYIYVREEDLTWEKAIKKAN